jgi:hypothetical protein
MPTYRVYTIKNGHISGPAEIIEATDDEAARQAAKRMVAGHAIEVWDGSRRIAIFDPLHQ